MAARTKQGRLQEMVPWLRANHPTPFPVTVRWAKLPRSGPHQAHGVTTRKGRRLYIYIDRRLCLSDMESVLMHEWAHAVVWRHESLERLIEVDHSDEWGLAYARIYRDIEDLGLV